MFGARIVQRTLEVGDARWPEGFQAGPDLLPDMQIHLVPPADPNVEQERPAREALQQLMWDQVGLVRTAAGLETALDTLSHWHAALPPAHRVAEHELHNLVLLGWLTAAMALRRTESRGGHYRSDMPDSSPAWRRRIVVMSPEAAQMIEEPALALAGAAERE